MPAEYLNEWFLPHSHYAAYGSITPFVISCCTMMSNMIINICSSCSEAPQKVQMYLNNDCIWNINWFKGSIFDQDLSVVFVYIHCVLICMARNVRTFLKSGLKERVSELGRCQVAEQL